MRHRVVITGIGVITPLGCDREEVWNALLAGKSGVRPITSFDTSAFDTRIGADCPDFNPGRWIDEREAKRLDRFSQFGIGAGSLAMQDAELSADKIDATRAGCIVGSGIGGLRELEEQHKRLFDKGPQRVSAFFIPKLMTNAVPGQLSIRFGLKGPNWAVASACASANHAMGSALRLIQYGEADVVLTGGCEAALTPSGLAGFMALRALSTRNDAPEKASRPFDKERDGFVLGEGAGMLVFERLDHAVKRGAKIYAEVLGVGNSADSYHITAPDPAGTGAAACMLGALKDGGVRPEEVTYINAHGTSTPLNDAIETKGIRLAFGDRAGKIPISSTKSMVGHLLGAAGGVELAVTALSVQRDVVHATINQDSKDPDCDLDYVPNTSRKVEQRYAISNSFGFGGHNSCVLIGKYRG
ncbi:MAG: beta-ketoacyl-ACP synthase II [Candidatus Brocadiae bacterium]|nr:beta-ketoacyl-ACP synthase II [Candidatus Brocadiia bacterium]